MCGEHFLSFRNYLQSRQYKNYECQQSFFLLPSLPPFSFLSRVVSRLMGVQNTRFRCRSGQNGQIFRSHLFKIQVDIASNCCQMAKNDRILADERPLQHFLAFLAHFINAEEAAHQPEFGHFLPSDNNCLQYLPGF